MRWLFVAAALTITSPAQSSEPSLDEAFERLAREGRFSGAIVIHGAQGEVFARGYGMADPFTGRRFTPDTPADSASLAKPVTAAAILLLASEGRIDLDSPVQRYLAEFPHAQTNIRHLLAHSAGLPFEDAPEALVDRSNAMLVAAVRDRQSPPLFSPGAEFAYCNLCYVALALIVERVTGREYLDFVRERLALPPGVTLRPRRLADWRGRAIGYRRTEEGRLERFDSWEGELFYGSGNFSLSARQLAQWGTRWWQRPLAPIRADATAPAAIDGRQSGLTLGNWYCAPRGRRCHYLGHHEGFHHLLYWDLDRRISIAMVSNNALAPQLQQRLQRALVNFAEGRAENAQAELALPLDGISAEPGRYRLATGEPIELVAEGSGLKVWRGGIGYAAHPIGSGIRYVPGLDLYIAADRNDRLRGLTLYEDWLASRVD